MDWLMFKFCVLIWILCVSKSQSQLRNSTSISTNNQLRLSCLEGQPVLPPDPCNTCICFSGQVHCTNVPCPEKECINGMELPQPDECNKCICRRGKVRCTNMICIPAPHCPENQLYPAQNKCNACMCKDGFISCTNNDCSSVEEPMTTTTTTTKPKKKKKDCEEGSRLPEPDQCLDCICQNGRRRCKYICNPIVQSLFKTQDTSSKPKKKKKCEEGSRLPVPNQCLDCICQNGKRSCKFICKSIVESRFEGPECSPGQRIARPDDCNNCICFEGQIHCTHLHCSKDRRTGPQCTDDQPVYQVDECNECYCNEGRLECSDLVCIRGSKCVAGQVIPKPDGCNTCKCVEGHIMCTTHQCPEISKNALLAEPSPTEVMPLEECKEGDYIPPPKPPNHCNTCFCVANHIVCTMISCGDPIPEFKGRIKEINEKTNPEKFDKKIPAEPFINNMYKNKDKRPHKLVHSHTYNGFHQEIKVHALPKDPTKLLNVLADSLDNAALASISQKLLTSNSVSSNQDSKKPFDHSVDQTNQLGEGNVLSAQSTKLITSGSQSNETILVFPDKEPFNDQDSESALPLESKHETTWKTVSAPDTSVYNNGIQILSRLSQKENGNDYHDNPPSIITPIDPNPTIITRNPAKFGRPGQVHDSPTKPARDTTDTPNIPTQSIYPTLHPKPININDDKMNYTPFPQENKQIKPAPSPSHLRPFQPTKPGPNHINTHISPTPVFRPEQYELNPDNIVGQQKPSQYQYKPNPPKVYPNKGTPQQFQSKPKPIPSQPTNYYNNKGVPLPAKFLNNPNQPIVSANRYKQPQFGLKPAPASSYPNNIPLNPAPTNLPYQKIRISTIENEAPQFELNSKPHHFDILNPSQNEVKPKHPNSPQSQLILNPSIYDKNEFEAPKIIEKLPYKVDISKKVSHYLNIPYIQLDQNEPHPKSIQSYLTPPGQRQNDTLYPTVTEMNKYDQHDSWKLKNKLFEEYPLSPSKNKQTDIKTNQKETPNVLPINFAIYLNKPSKPQLVSPQDNSEKEDSEDPTHPKSNDHQLPPSQTGPPQNQHTPGMFDDRESNNGYSLNVYEDPRQFKPLHKLPPPKLETPPNHQLPGPADGVQNPFNLAEDLTHPKVKLNKSSHFGPYKSMLNAQQPKDNQHIPLYSQFGPTQNQHKPGDNRGVKDGFRYEHNANEDHREPKPLYTLSLFPPGPTLNKQKPGMFDERGSPDGFRHPSYLAENPKHSRGNLHNHPPNQFGPDKKRLPGVFENHGSVNGFHYPFKSADISLLPKDKQNNLFIKNGPTENQHVPWRFDDRGSAGVLQNPPSSTENSLFPKGNIQNLPHPKLNPNQNQRLPGVFDGRGSTDGLHYPTKSAKLPFQPKHNNPYKPQNSPVTPTQKQKLPGISDDQGSADGFHYPTNSTLKPFHPNYNPYKMPKSPFRPTQKQHLPGDDRGSTNSLPYPSNSTQNPFNPKNNLHNPSNSQFRPTQKYKQPGVFADGIQYPSNSAKDRKHSNENIRESPNVPFGPILNKPTQGTFGDRGSVGGPQYPFNSAEDPKHPKVKSPHSQFGPVKHLPGIFDERGSADGFQYPSHSGGYPLQPKSNQQNPSHPKLGPNQNQHLPGMFDERGPDSFQFPSNSVGNPTHPKHNLHNPPQSQFIPYHNQHTSGVFDDRGSADGFQYPSHFAENPLQPKGNQQNPSHLQLGPNQNQHLPGKVDERGPDSFQFPYNSVGNPTHPKQNLFNPLQSQFIPYHNQHMPGVFDDRESTDGFQYPSHSAKNPLQPKGNQQNPSHLQLGPNQNQHMPGVIDDRGFTDGFQYPSHSADNPLQPKDNHQNSSHPELDPSQNQHIPVVFDTRGSANGFQYPSHSAENPLQPKGNKKNPSHSQLGSNQAQDMPGVFDKRGSTDGFQYPSHSAEDTKHSKENTHNQPNSPFGPTQNEHLPGLFHDRGSADGFQYPSHSVENPLQPKDTQQNPSHPQLSSNENQQMPGVFDDRGSTDGFQYPSHSAENPLHPKDNHQNSSHPELDPSQNQHIPVVFDTRGSADGFQYPSHSADNPLQPKDNHQNSSHPELDPSQNQHIPVVFDTRGSANGFQYPSHSAENPLHPKDNQQNPSHPQLSSNENQQMPGVFDDRGSTDGFQYPSHSAENPLHPKDNHQNSSHPQLGLSQNQHIPGVFDTRGSADGFQYPSHSADNPLQPKDNHQNSSHPQLGPSQNQHIPGVFDTRGSADGFQYLSHSTDNPLQPKDNHQNQSHTQLGPNENQHMPGEFDDRGFSDGFHYPSDSAEDPIHPNDNPDTTPESNSTQSQNQPKPSSLDQIPQNISKNYNDKTENQPTSNNYNNNNAVRPWMYLDHDQYKPSSFDNLPYGVHNIPWSLPKDHDKVVNTVSSTHSPRFKPDYDQYKPSSFDKLFNEIHHLPRPAPNQDNNALGSNAGLTTPVFKTEQDQYDNIDLFDEDDDYLQTEIDNSTDLINSDSMQSNPNHRIKPDNVLDSLLPTHDGNFSDFYVKPNTLFKALKKLSEPSNDDSGSKLTSNKLKNSTENIPFNGFDLEILEKIMNDFKEDPQTTPIPRFAETTNDNDNRSHSIPTALEETQQQGTKKYPEVHIILHQPDDEYDLDLPPYIEADGEAGLATDMGPKEVHSPLFPNMFYPRFKYRPKDQKDECGDGTTWISNCHRCSCYFGQTMCLRMQDCKLRPFGEPMLCKPYSHFKMGCYTCECNGDGVTECDATDCGKEPKEIRQVSDSHELALPKYHEFFDNKTTDEILQYYKINKKLPKDCPRENSQIEYPTCERGTSWISSCHKCECNETGKHECAKIEDCVLDFKSYGKPSRCKPNSKFYPKTNTMPCVECLCNDEGIPSCPEADIRKH